jgi:hypothetical protein
MVLWSENLNSTTKSHMEDEKCKCWFNTMDTALLQSNMLDTVLLQFNMLENVLLNLI